MRYSNNEAYGLKYGEESDKGHWEERYPNDLKGPRTVFGSYADYCKAKEKADNFFVPCGMGGFTAKISKYNGNL